MQIYRHPVKTESDCPACGVHFVHMQLPHTNGPFEVDELLPVWCTDCWDGWTEEEKQAASAAKLPEVQRLVWERWDGLLPFEREGLLPPSYPRPVVHNA